MFSRTTKHLTPLRAIATRRSTPRSTLLPPRQLQLQRVFSRLMPSRQQQTQPPQPSEEQSINSQFFKTFGRPIAKVFLVAIFTYQLAYYLWVRLEQDETKSEMLATIADLEARIEQLEKAPQK
ncbi:hypothetical protein M426DRAFT_319511 [Hypoxylon sp. CI-4A]|nr:hypothetical protein M426DRAFT_319511 [Hypoxylon sp. CI-4A]